MTIDVFCSGHSQLGDGRVVIVGGGGVYESSHAHTVIFNPDSPPSNPWTIADDMPGGQQLGIRWYPTCTTLGDGTVLVTGGDYPNSNPHTADVPLLFDASKAAMQQYDALTGGNQHLPLYPHLFQLSNQVAFYAGTANRLPLDGPAVSQKLNPVLETWTTVAANPTQNGAAVMHRPDQVLMAGGQTNAGAVTNEVYLIEPNARTPTWTARASMAYAREFFNLVLLPDGRALAVGGQGPTQMPVLLAELYNPTNNSWQTTEAMALPRIEHSTAVLLPDGRVAVAGDLSHAGLTAQIYSPPYLFQGPRPTISNAPSTMAYGQSFTIDSPNAQQVTQVSLVRLGATTHHFDQNQRFVPLEFVILGAGTGGPFSVLAAAPAHANLAPPRYYLLFILVNGVPSEAAMVRLTPA